MNLEQIVIENIKKIRREKHISQEKLAEYCGTSASYIGLMETYKNIPKLSTIERIAQAMNVPVLELFTHPESSQNDDGTSSDKTCLSPEKKAENESKEKEHKEKIRNQIKSEILNKMSNNLDDILKLI